MDTGRDTLRSYRVRTCNPKDNVPLEGKNRKDNAFEIDFSRLSFQRRSPESFRVRLHLNLSFLWTQRVFRSESTRSSERRPIFEDLNVATLLDLVAQVHYHLTYSPAYCCCSFLCPFLHRAHLVFLRTLSSCRANWHSRLFPTPTTDVSRHQPSPQPSCQPSRHLHINPRSPHVASRFTCNLGIAGARDSVPGTCNFEKKMKADSV